MLSGAGVCACACHRVEPRQEAGDAVLEAFSLGERAVLALVPVGILGLLACAPRKKTRTKNEKCRQGARTSATRQRVRAKHLAQNKDFGPGAPAAGGVKCRPSRACLIMHFVRMYLCLQGPIIHCRCMYLDLCGSYGTSHYVYYKTTQGHQHTCVFVFACFIWYITSCILHDNTRTPAYNSWPPSM